MSDIDVGGSLKILEKLLEISHLLQDGSDRWLLKTFVSAGAPKSERGHLNSTCWTHLMDMFNGCVCVFF